MVAHLAACESPMTMVELEVQYDDAWGLDRLRLNVDTTAPGITSYDSELRRELTVVVPDSWAGDPHELEVWGMQGATGIARGTTVVTPIAGASVRATVSLVPLSCEPSCAPGDRTCANEAVASCEIGSDGCPRWAEPTPCDAATPYCSAGQCRVDCVDECVAGATRCSGTSGVQSCGTSDLDPCLDWASVTPCSSGSVCEGGACVETCAAGCEDPPDPTCVDGGTLRVYAPFGSCASGTMGDCAYTSTDVACSSSCSAGACACVESTCTRVQVAGNQDSPVAIAVDGSHVYWTSFYGGTVYRRPRSISGPIEVVATGPVRVREIAVDATHVYWAQNGEGTVLRRAKTLGAAPVETVGDDLFGSWSVALDETHVYWTANGAFKRRRKTLGASPVETVETEGAGDLALDSTHVYWTRSSDGAVRRRIKTLAAPAENVATGSDDATQLALDATHVYWTAVFAERVYRRAKTLGAEPVELVASGQAGASGIVADETYVYWAAHTDNRVARRAKTLGAAQVEILASNQTSAAFVAIDAFHLYWTTDLDVRRLSRCACDL